MESNGTPNGRWKLTARDLVLIVSGVLGGLAPAVGGYYVLQYRVGVVESRCVSHEQLDARIATSSGDQKRADQALVDLGDKVDELVQEIRQMRGEWSNYSSHPKGHRQ